MKLLMYTLALIVCLWLFFDLDARNKILFGCDPLTVNKVDSYVFENGEMRFFYTTNDGDSFWSDQLYDPMTIYCKK